MGAQNVGRIIHEAEVGPDCFLPLHAIEQPDNLGDGALEPGDEGRIMELGIGQDRIDGQA